MAKLLKKPQKKRKVKKHHKSKALDTYFIPQEFDDVYADLDLRNVATRMEGC